MRCDAISISVCLSVGEHISKTTRPSFTKFLVRVAYGRGLVLLWRRCNKLLTSGFMDDVRLAHNGQRLHS